RNASSTARTLTGAQRDAPTASVWIASINSGEAAPMAENASAETTPLAARSARRSRGGWLLVMWMSQPPVTASGSAYAVRVAVSNTADTVRLSTTSANIVSVSPVRKRFAATYAVLNRHSAAGARKRRRMPTLYASTQTAPSSIVTPLRKLISTTGGNSDSGSIHHTMSATPARLKTTRSGPRNPSLIHSQRARSAAPTIATAIPTA